MWVNCLDSMEIHFSKIEQISDKVWRCVVAPKDLRSGVKLTTPEYKIIEGGFEGEVVSTASDGKEITVKAVKGRPGEGRTYSVERSWAV